jgi:DnaJ domain
MVTPNHYDTLGVQPTADAAALRQAYLSLARRFHPDRFAAAPPAERVKAERRMQELNAAWTVLGDTKARASYDSSLMSARSRATGPVVSARQQERAATARPTAPRKRIPQVATREEMEFSGFARIMRPVPLLLIGAFVAAVVVLATAMGGGSSERLQDRATTPTGTPLGCITLIPQAVAVPCVDHAAVVWSVVEAGRSCPEGLEAIYRDGVGGLFCVTLVES